jgi:hypothetical protein
MRLPVRGLVLLGASAALVSEPEAVSPVAQLLQQTAAALQQATGEEGWQYSQLGTDAGRETALQAAIDIVAGGPHDGLSDSSKLVAGAVSGVTNVDLQELQAVMRTSVWIVAAGSTAVNGAFRPNGTRNGLAQYHLAQGVGLHSLYHEKGQWIIRQVFSDGNVGLPLYVAERRGDSPLPPSIGWRLGVKGTLPVPLAMSWTHSKEVGRSKKWNTTFVSIKFGVDLGIAHVMFKYAAALGIAQARGSVMQLGGATAMLDGFSGPFAPHVTDADPAVFEIQEADSAGFGFDSDMYASLYAQHVEIGTHLQCRRYFDNVEEQVRKIFTPAPRWRLAADEWRKEHGLDSSVPLTCIHIRRGNLMKRMWSRVPSADWYARHMALSEEGSKFVVFTGKCSCPVLW